MRIPRASEFFILGIAGEELNLHEQAFIKENRLGGIILFKRNISSLEQVVKLNSSIIKAHAFSPLICVDQEGGRVARLRGICTDIPSMLELKNAFKRDKKLAHRLANMQGQELRSLGFDLNFSPVCDVLSNAGNQVIGDRAFSNDALEVAEISREWIEGLQTAGIAACAKHFPGHGATSVDSHFALPVQDRSLDQLLERELIPFKSAIEAGVSTIMTAHIINQAIDPLPATLSKLSIKKLLRGELGFSGVVISDDLEMKAVADNYDLAYIIESGFRASVDMFIMGPDLAKNKEAIEILQNLIDKDKEIQKHSILSAQRIDYLRNRFLGRDFLGISSAREVVRCFQHLELISQIFAEA